MMRLYRLLKKKFTKGSSISKKKNLSASSVSQQDQSVVHPPPVSVSLAASVREHDLQQVFRTIDTDGDGKISLDELRVMMKSFSTENPDETDLLRLLREIDSDGDGYISMEEFIRMNEKITPDELKAAFQMFDIDGNGFISTDELHKVLNRLDSKVTKSECIRMIRGVDADGDGMVNFEEFQTMMNQEP